MIRNISFTYLLLGLLVLIVTVLIFGTIWTSEMVSPVEGLGNRPDNIARLKDPDSSDPYKFLLLGDSSKNSGVWGQLLKRGKEEGVVFAVNLGDAIYPKEGNCRFVLTELKELDLGFPCFFIPGNHDLRLEDSTMLEFFQQAFGPLQCFFVFRDDLFILLNNALGDLKNKDYNWLKKVLERQSPGKRHIFLFMHKPTRWDHEGNLINEKEAMFTHLHALVNRFGIDYVFSGHCHSYRREAIDGCVYIITGGAGSRLEDENSFFHSVTISVNGDNVTDKVKPITEKWNLHGKFKYRVLNLIDRHPLVPIGLLCFLLCLAGTFLLKGILPTSKLNERVCFSGFNKSHAVLLILFFLIVISRLMTLDAAPLFDITEGLNAEISREMALSGNWITPSLEEKLPFWGKPPLHFWLTAISFRLFGITEFTSRLPSLLASLVILLFLWIMARRLFGVYPAICSILVLVSSILFFVYSGVVIPDMSLTLCISGAMMSFSLWAFSEQISARKHWGLVFFAFLGLGMLAKGPVAIALCLIAVILWAFVTGRVGALKKLPWVPGSLLTLAVCAPWYILAEIQTPGFIKYFLINENLLRYLIKEYGDLYGQGHALPYGSIWGFWFITTLPWSPLIIFIAFQIIRGWFKRKLKVDACSALLWCWALSPLLFFTTARLVLVYYTLPCLPAFSIIAGRFISQFRSLTVMKRKQTYGAICFPLSPIIASTGIACIVGLIACLIYAHANYGFPRLEIISTIGFSVVFALGFLIMLWSRSLINLFATLAVLVPVASTTFYIFLSDEIGLHRSTQRLAEVLYADQRLVDEDVVFFDDVPYSAEFYLADATLGLDENNELLHGELNDHDDDVIVVEKQDLKDISRANIPRMHLITQVGHYFVYLD